jgi:hypothetical protein
MIIAGIVGILIWGLVGYFTVKVTLVGIDIDRAARVGTVWFTNQKTMEQKAEAMTKRKRYVL